MNPMVFLKKPIVLVAIAAVIVVFLLSSAMPAGIFDTWNTTGATVTGCEDMIEAGATFSKAAYVGAWMPNMDSEDMVVEGKFRFLETDWPDGVAIGGYRYKLYVYGSDTPAKTYPADGSYASCAFYTITMSNWFTEMSTGLPTNVWYTFPTWVTNVRTDGDIQMKVVLELDAASYDAPNIGDFDYGWTQHLETYGWDGAYLYSGRGEIYLPTNQQGPFEEGQDVNIYVSTGYTGGAGWAVKIYPPFDRTDLDQTGTVLDTIGDDTQTYVSWTVPTGAFQVGSTNIWRAELWNNFFNRGFEQILTIDQLDRAPIITSVSAVNSGTSMTYTVTCNQTYAALSHILVYAWYGYGGTTMPPEADLDSWVMYAQYIAISGNTATFTVTPEQRNGTIVVKIIPYDVDGRPGTPGYESIVVENGRTTPGGNPLTQPFIWNWVVMALILLAVVAFGAVFLFWPGDLMLKIIVGAAIALMLAFLAYLYGSGAFI